MKIGKLRHIVHEQWMRATIAALVLLLAPTGAHATDDDRGIRAVYAETRTALVIGNAAYPNGPLRNPVNDALDLAELLTQRSFDVTLLTDADKREMETAIREFGKKLAGGGVGLFYYAGHAVQADGVNYLMPIDAAPTKETDTQYMAVNAGLVLGELGSKSNRLNLVILDACRDNPFARSFRSASRGLATMDSPRGTLIAYATSSGKSAADGDGRNGTYTRHLIEQMRVPGQELQDMFREVRANVERATAGAQIPQEWDSTTGRFYFTPIDVLDDQLDLTTAELAHYQQLLDEQRAADLAIEDLQASKFTAIAEMERQIEALRMQISEPGSADNTLDQLLSLGKQREQYQKDMEAAREKAEEERRAREAKIARLRALELSKRRARFEADYEKYRWIINSELMQPAERMRAWRLICTTWGVEDASEIAGPLFWDGVAGTVSATMPDLNGIKVVIVFRESRNLDAGAAESLLLSMGASSSFVRQVESSHTGELHYWDIDSSMAAHVAVALEQIEQLSPIPGKDANAKKNVRQPEMRLYITR
ncbi:MAG: hypothetical protein HOH43_00025 [Candidatus Latescibacteria bacterium]|nr:hypothetical protein [Candidatus Latescibacterota bacterium]